MSVQLGTTPEQMTLALTEGADFVCTLVSNDGAWPVGAVVAITVAGTTWTATIVGSEARFNVDKAAVDTVIGTTPRTFRLTYTEGAADLVWGRGAVVVTRA